MSDAKRKQQPRVCEECGCDRLVHRDIQWKLEAHHRIKREAEDLARDNGLLRYQLSVAEARRREEQSIMQRKVVRQARIIRKFEQRLRDLGKKPWAGMAKPGQFDTAPAAEYDAGQRLPGEPE